MKAWDIPSDYNYLYLDHSPRYVDPDGVRREFEYVSGNPCDPNAPKEELEEEEEDEAAAPPPRPLLRRIRPQINDDQLQGLQQVREEALSEDQLNQFVRPVTRQRVVSRPQQQPSPRPASGSPPRPNSSTSNRISSFDNPRAPSPSGLLSTMSLANPLITIVEARLSQISRPISQPQPLYEQPLQVVQRHHNNIASQPSRQVFGGQSFRSTHATPTAPSPTTSSGQKNPNFGRYRTELVYDPSSGQYTSVVVQAMPHSNQEFELTQKLRAFVEPQRSNNVQVSNFGQPQIQYYTNTAQPSHRDLPKLPLHNINSNIIKLTRNAYSQQNLEARQQQEQQITNYNTFIPPHLRTQSPSPSAPPQQVAPQVHHVQPQQIEQQQRQFQYPTQTIDTSGRNPANGQIDAFLRSLNINI
ncbi:hypothetical protein Ocin01_11820 [Orchesella cincta]|uniref:Uncharacterized protein n=1 Tax=Orchesella cincta TaxID=48709 RepID=A0A1D2MP47_ORCCI|nr:hypothetical protein Ocin01_11820 [Orchesella cincta]